MTNTGPVLDYISPRPPPTKLTLEEADGSLRVIFAVKPAWGYMLPIVTGLTMGALMFLAGIRVFHAAWGLASKAGYTSRDAVAWAWHLSVGILFDAVVMALFCWILAAYEWLRFRHWGRVPLILTASNEGLVSSRLGLWRMRERRWPADQIVAVELRPAWGNLSWKRTVAYLYFRRSKGRPLFFILSSSDSQLPSRIAQRLAFVLGCPLA